MFTFLPVVQPSVMTCGAGIRQRRPGRNWQTCQVANKAFKAPIGTERYTFLGVPSIAAGATEVAQMNIGGHLVVFWAVSGGHTTIGAQATQSGDWGKVIVNAGNWLLNCRASPTPTP